MKSRRVQFARTALQDLELIEERITFAASATTARRYVDRVTEKCRALKIAAERGTTRFDLRPGLRVIGFEKRLTIAFVVTDHEVTIVRVFSAGRDWEGELSEE